MADREATDESGDQSGDQSGARWRAPWAVVMTAVLLLAFEFGVARQDWFWGWIPFSQVGAIDALERQVIPESEPAILFMGSSRVRDAISPRELEKRLRLPQGSVLNLGLTMGTPFDAEILYRRNRDSLSQAKLVFFGVEPFQLDYNNAPTERVLRYGTLQDRLKLMKRGDRVGAVVGFFWRTLDSGPFVQRFIKSGFKSIPDLPPVAEDGRVQWRTPEDNKRARHRKVSVDTDRFFRGWRFSANRQRKMRELFALFEEDGITLVVFQVPARDRFWTRAHSLYPEKVKEYSKRVREASEGHDVLMFWSGSEHQLRGRNFYDYGHLKPRPARAFTRRIGRLIDKNYSEVLESVRGESKEASPAIIPRRPRKKRTRRAVAP